MTKELFETATAIMFNNMFPLMDESHMTLDKEHSIYDYALDAYKLGLIQGLSAGSTIASVARITTEETMEDEMIEYMKQFAEK